MILGVHYIKHKCRGITGASQWLYTHTTNRKLPKNDTQYTQQALGIHILIYRGLSKGRKLISLLCWMGQCSVKLIMKVIYFSFASGTLLYVHKFEEPGVLAVSLPHMKSSY